MGERERFYAPVLGVPSPWRVSGVELVEEAEEVRVLLQSADLLRIGVDKVWRTKHRKLMAEDDRTLVRSQFVWLQDPDNMGSKLATALARMVRAHLNGIIKGIVLKATNAGAESVNSRIQKIKRMACGFRTRDRSRAAIYFHLAGLDLRPSTHTNS